VTGTVAMALALDRVERVAGALTIDQRCESCR
jgi:hypothetical protein